MYYPRWRNSTTVSHVLVSMMDSAPATSLWGYDLGQSLGGTFTAHARGLLAMAFVLRDRAGEEFGRLHLGGVSGAELRSTGSPATFEASGGGYRMVADGEEILSAAPKGRSVSELEVLCGGRSYEARLSLLRNLAVASSASGERAAYLSGGLTGRSYEVFFAEGDAFPVAVFLLWYVVAHRRRAYRTGGGVV